MIAKMCVVICHFDVLKTSLKHDKGNECQILRKIPINKRGRADI